MQILQRMLTVNREALDSIQLHEDLVMEKVTYSAGAILSRVMIDGAVGARTRRMAQASFVLEAVLRTLEKQTQ